jgi:hypothetical protein
MRFLFLIISFSFINLTFSQSKKEHIEILNKKIDSLNRVISNERNLNSENVNSLNLNILNLENQISNLETEKSTLNDNIVKLKKELKIKTDEIQSKSLEIKSLEDEVNEKTDTIELYNSVIKNLNAKIELITPPSFLISDFELISLADFRMINPCPKENVLGETGPNICKKNVSSIQYFKKGNTTRFFANIGYSFTGAHFDSGQDGFILAEYQNSKWTVIDFMQFQQDGCWGNSLDIQDKFLLGDNTFGCYSESCAGAQGFTGCVSYIIGFSGNKISIFLEESSSENNLSSGENPVINWKYYYKPQISNNKYYSIERQLFQSNKFDSTETLKFNSELLRFE